MSLLSPTSSTDDDANTMDAAAAATTSLADGGGGGDAEVTHEDEEIQQAGLGDGLATADKEGFLEKRGEVRKKWKRRYFVLKNNRLRYFKKPTDAVAKGEISLEGCSVEFVAEERYGRKFCFELHTHVKNRVYVLAAESGTNMQDWLSEIRRAMLRIRRARSKQASARRVEGLLRDEEAKAQRRLTGGSQASTSEAHGRIIDYSYSSASTLDGGDTELVGSGAGGAQSGMGGGGGGPDGGGESFVLPNGVQAPADATSDDKYNMYLSWLQETKSHQRRGTVADRHEAYSMHERLLDEGENPNGCPKFCTGCQVM